MRVAGDGSLSPIASLNALSDPEGSLLIVDATTAPHIHEYRSVEKFLESSDRTSRSRSKTPCWRSYRAMASPTSFCRLSAAGSPSAYMISSAASR
jgi:hypothetical protein